MQLTRYSDYSLRVLIYLALDPERLVTIEDIARSYDISRAHLMKVVHQLGLRGYVETVRGRGGGLRLGRRPEEIGIGDVVRSTEENLNLVDGFDPAPPSAPSSRRAGCVPCCTKRSPPSWACSTATRWPTSSRGVAGRWPACSRHRRRKLRPSGRVHFHREDRAWTIEKTARLSS
jgi:Rrf2 family protein